MRARHPITEALAARPPWSPAPLTRALQRVSGAVRDVSAQIDPVERMWHDLAESSLHAAIGANPPPLWVVMGDSTAQGIGATTVDHAWVSRLHAALASCDAPHAVVNISRSGAHTSHVIEEQVPLLELLPYPPSIVTVCIGANDLMSNPNPNRLIKRMRQLAGSLPAGSIVSTLPGPRFSPTGMYVARAIRAAADQHDLVVADLGPHSVAPHRGLARDRYHPNDRGYGAWVKAFAAPMGIDLGQIPVEGTLISSRLAPSTPGTTTSG